MNLDPHLQGVGASLDQQIVGKLKRIHHLGLRKGGQGTERTETGSIELPKSGSAGKEEQVRGHLNIGDIVNGFHRPGEPETERIQNAGIENMAFDQGQILLAALRGRLEEESWLGGAAGGVIKSIADKETVSVGNAMVHAEGEKNSLVDRNCGAAFSPIPRPKEPALGKG